MYMKGLVWERGTIGAGMGAARAFSGARCRSRDEVYVAAVALKGPAQLLFSLNLWDLQHFMVITKPSSSSYPLTVYDFQPQDPESIWLAAAALSHTKIPGAILVRKLSKLPQRKCWFVGYTKEDADVHTFNHTWETHLLVGSHDCRHYTQGLVEHLTGNKYILDHLRSNYL
ncbi:hypothetical protein SASPL_132320 [Salvia splendens]|uniref:Uncharacterized protein n=2 Tax=Salvia splendens TaxID=180675 RepID=A0A8X8ZI33_SALSN|nr:hypothetical protein SASPL_132320 [Salvia splendens]